MKATQLEGTLINPWQRWVLRRYLEGDALAYGGFFGADRLEKGLPTGTGFGREGMAAEIAMRLRGELQFSRDGLTPTEYLRLAFEPAMGSLEPYNNNHLSYITEQITQFERDVRDAANGNRQKLQDLKMRMAATPTDAQFEAKLRQFGTLARDFMPLQNASQQALLQDYPRLGTAGFEQKLDSEMQKLSERHNAAMRQLQELTRKASPAEPRPRA